MIFFCIKNENEKKSLQKYLTLKLLTNAFMIYKKKQIYSTQRKKNVLIWFNGEFQLKNSIPLVNVSGWSQTTLWSGLMLWSSLMVLLYKKSSPQHKWREYIEKAVALYSWRYTFRFFFHAVVLNPYVYLCALMFLPLKKYNIIHIDIQMRVMYTKRFC